jgi:plasmid stability protein
MLVLGSCYAMPTLYVENVPSDLYKALRERARQNRNSITAEVLSLLRENVVTSRERRDREAFFRQAQRLRGRPSSLDVLFPASEQMQREHRRR